MLRNLNSSFFKKLCFLLFPILQSACTSIGPENEAFGTFTNAFSNEIEKEYGFGTYGVGASMPVKIENIDLSFQASYPANVEEARRIVVPIALKFIQRMNEDPNLMKYLANSPASLKNVILTIGFKELYIGGLESVMVIGSRDRVIYNKHEENKIGLFDLHEETFDEALSIYQLESD